MDNSKSIISNLIWRFLERCGAQGVTFIVSLVLARILDPNVYGTIALVTVFVELLQVFINRGMGNALIQKKDADELDFSSAFFFNIVVSFILYAIIFMCAPFIARFYAKQELVTIVRVLASTLLLSGIRNIQEAYVSRNMLFRKFFFSTIGGTIGSAIVGIGMALLGYGVWALVLQTITNSLVGTIILWLTVPWRPKFIFSLKRAMLLFSYGWKLLVSGLLDTGYRELSSLIIGKLYSANALAFYNRGMQLPNLVVTNINTSIDSVLFPVMSMEQDNYEKVREMTRKAIQISTYLLMPLMVGLAVCGEPVIEILLTEKWLPCVPFLRIFCFTYAFYPIHTANLNAIKAMGRSDLFLKLEVVKKVVGLLAILLTMRHSVEAMAYSLLLTSILSQIINSWPNKKLLRYSYIQQIRDIFPQIILSGIMGGVVYSITTFEMDSWGTLLVQVPLGIIIYIIGSKILHIDSFEYFVSIIKDCLKAKKDKV